MMLSVENLSPHKPTTARIRIIEYIRVSINIILRSFSTDADIEMCSIIYSATNVTFININSIEITINNIQK